uniref:Putative transposase strongylocentrotus purpuratus: similar to transposase n=1 Tax=Ixodes ricinus TaxID=34613 RepID=A0A0K8RD56_IXORI
MQLDVKLALEKDNHNGTSVRDCKEETVKKQQADLHVEDSLNLAYAASPQTCKANARKPSKEATKETCPLCGQSPHSQNKHPAKKSNCNKCQKIGHLHKFAAAP